MTERRKQYTMTITVSVAPHVTAAEARREVRTLINEQVNYHHDPEDVRCKKIVPGRKAVAS